jgi:hypothetical protein
MNAFVLIIPIMAALLISDIVIPRYAPAPRAVTASPAELSPAEIRRRVRAQKWKEAMKVESVTAGDSDW